MLSYGKMSHCDGIFRHFSCSSSITNDKHILICSLLLPWCHNQFDSVVMICENSLHIKHNTAEHSNPSILLYHPDQTTSFDRKVSRMLGSSEQNSVAILSHLDDAKSSLGTACLCVCVCVYATEEILFFSVWM